MKDALESIDITELYLENCCEVLGDHVTEFTKVIFHALPEYDRPQDHFDDYRNIQAIINNECEWFCACVEIKIKGVQYSTEYLGCCAYLSFQDFIDSRDCLTDMVNQALQDAETEIRHKYLELGALVTMMRLEEV